MVDVARLQKCVEWVEEQENRPHHESEWDQEAWIQTSENECGTVACIAGKVVLDAYGLEAVKFLTPFSVTTVQGRHISTVAANLLDLDIEQALELFAAHNTAADIRKLAEEFAGKEL